MTDYENDRFRTDAEIGKSLSPSMQEEMDKLDAEIAALMKDGDDEPDDDEDLPPAQDEGPAGESRAARGQMTAQDSPPDVANEPRRSDGEWTSGGGGAPAAEAASPTRHRSGMRHGHHHGASQQLRAMPGEEMPAELKGRIKIHEESVSAKVEATFLKHISSVGSAPASLPKIKARIEAVHAFFDREDVEAGVTGAVHHIIADLPYHVSGVALNWLEDNATDIVKDAVVGAATAASVAVLGVGVPEAVIGAAIGYTVDKIAEALGLDGEHAVKALERVVATAVAVYHERKLERQGVVDPEPFAKLLLSYAKTKATKSKPAVVPGWTAPEQNWREIVAYKKAFGKPEQAHDAFDPQERRGQPGNAGEWTSGGGAGAKAKGSEEGEEFVSPNVENLDFGGAFKALSSPRQKLLLQAAASANKQLGIDAQSIGAIGAWSDGAENSVVTMTHGASIEQLRAAAAMQGALADQKAVLIFHEHPGAKGWLYSFPATGKVEDIHKALLEDGLAFHTLIPTQGGAKVFIADTDGTLDAAVEKGAKRYGSAVEARNGDAEFVGTGKEDGTDREQRDDAQRAYAGVISGPGVQGAAAVWDRVHSAYQQSFNALRPAEPAEGAAAA